jgi:hypothetical protein
MTPLDSLIRRAWPILREAARVGRTVTYSELASRVGPPLTRRHLHRQLLSPLGARCAAAGLPPLPALVVRKDTGAPGIGYHLGDRTSTPQRTWALDLEACWSYPWPAEPDPRLFEERKRRTARSSPEHDAQPRKRPS